MYKTVDSGSTDAGSIPVRHAKLKAIFAPRFRGLNVAFSIKNVTCKELNGLLMPITRHQ